MLGPVLASAAFGLLKGFATPRGQSSSFSFVADVWGPVREEATYRAAPFRAFGDVPHGSTAAAFAADHLFSDMRQQPMTAAQLVGRFGDVLLGGYIYEKSYRAYGILGAVASHVIHNVAVTAGERLRRR